MESGISTYSRHHPCYNELLAYSIEAPSGTWIGRLDYVFWGKAHNLLCFFTEEENGGKYRLSTFWNNAFRPQKNGPAFNTEPLGNRYLITTEISLNRLPKFTIAQPLVETL